MARGVQQRSSGSIRPLHTVTLVAVLVVGVLIGFWALHFIAGVIWLTVKLVVILAVVAGVAWLLLGRRKR